ncbi:MAG: metallophosphoesterase [Planctomycetales bacterium]|nr:metallophosphoesterase [Planctomycetales bacterium]
MNYQSHSRRHVRTLFVSDVHLGYRYANAAAFYCLLDQFEADYVYLVGDFIDGWRLKRTWHWQPVYNHILRRRGNTYRSKSVAKIFYSMAGEGRGHATRVRSRSSCLWVRTSKDGR